MNKYLKIALTVLVVAAIFGAVGFLIWTQDTSGPAPEAIAALESDDLVTVETIDDMIVFRPANNPDPTTGFIFYPGGKVEPESYAPPLRLVAEQGYLVVLVPVRLNLAFFDINAAKPVFDMFPDVEHWGIGGHSLGGVAASTFASKNEQIQGIAFWASYPANDSLKDSALKITSIYGTNDGLCTPEDIEASKALLPEDTVYVAIEGGNHGQFGAYGPQDGDNPADISAEDQWQQTADATANMLGMLTTMPDVSVGAPTPVATPTKTSTISPDSTPSGPVTGATATPTPPEAYPAYPSYP